MAFEKGQSGNPAGRKKGTPNKATGAIRGWLVELINNNRERIEKDFAALEPLQRLAMLEKLLPYLLPKVTDEKAVEGAAFTADDIDAESWERDVVKWYDKPAND